ncbi:MAG: TetR/AcrR family transcriptional regulator [Bacteroidales bacterium]|nr:TetR/AcrR family transcriptional regulator [Bacteroidales bacterium]
MSIAKTRQLLIDVARELFASKGFNATTMNDIATASHKGRRTLYTYFSSKQKIYYAVIESELERMSDRMDELATMEATPEQKITMIIYSHLSMIKETVARNGSLRAEFFRNIWKVELVRKKFDIAERDLLRQVLQEGKATGKFKIEDVNLYADIIQHCLKGLEVPYIFGRLGEGHDEVTSRPIVAGLVRRALGMPEHG